MQPFIDAMEGRNRYTNPRSTYSLFARVFCQFPFSFFGEIDRTDFTFLFSVMKPVKAIFSRSLPTGRLRRLQWLCVEDTYLDSLLKTRTKLPRERFKRVCRKKRLGLNIRVRTEGILDRPWNDEESSSITVIKFNFLPQSEETHS